LPAANEKNVWRMIDRVGGRTCSLCEIKCSMVDLKENLPMNRRAKYFLIAVQRTNRESRATDHESRSYDVGDFHQAGDVVSFCFG